MTIKEIYEKTVFGSLTPASIKDYNVCYVGEPEVYLEAYKKASRKNAAYKYRRIKALLDMEAVIVKYTSTATPIYEIITRRSFEGAFSTPLKEYQKIILE